MAIKKGVRRVGQSSSNTGEMMVCVNALSWELVHISGAQKETPETELENPRA